MSEQVTTREELDALPEDSVIASIPPDEESRLESGVAVWCKSNDQWFGSGCEQNDLTTYILSEGDLFILYRPDEPQRVQPSRASIARALHYQDCRCPRFDEPDHVDYVHMADAVLTLLAFQPTVAEVRERAADEIAATAKVIRDAHGGAPPDVVGHILAGYAQAEGVVRAAEGGAR